MVLTDIPYGVVNRDNPRCIRIRSFDKGRADIVGFDLQELTKTLCDITKGSIYMFCSTEQLSEIRKTMIEKGLSTRVIVWEKSNPSPINGEHLWLSGIELCVFGKKGGGVFNLRCHNSVLKFPSVRSTIHPTQKPVDLFRYLIRASSNKGDLIFDPFIGSGTTAVAAFAEKRNFLGFELCKEFYEKATKRIQATMSCPMLDLD